jgi:hypothetical protein
MNTNLANQKITQHKYQQNANEYLQSGKAYLSITNNGDDTYNISLFGHSLGTAHGSEQALEVETIVKNTLIVAGLIKP